MKRALACLPAIISLLCFVGGAHAAVISEASQTVRGNVVEVRFVIHGRGLSWRPIAQHQQLVLELDGARLDLPSHPLDGALTAPLQHVIANALGPNARITFELSGKVDYAIAVAGNHLIVRFARAGAAPEIAAPIVTRQPYRSTAASRRLAKPPELKSTVDNYPRPPELETAAIRPATVQSRAFQSAPLVMIDPGHGGRDPGTSSGSGDAEKSLALQIALRVRTALVEAGLRAEMTRTDDRFVSLAERTRMANQAGADLFVSIHLNSSPDTMTAGIESYYLNNTTDRATIRLARMENADADGYTSRAGANLGYILTDLRQNDKANESESLAQMIEAETVGLIVQQTGVRTNDLGARSGPFYVLVGAEMPSVLVECGFLSNPAEAERLSEPRYQAALADGIAAAVMNYLGSAVAVGNL